MRLHELILSESRVQDVHFDQIMVDNTWFHAERVFGKHAEEFEVGDHVDINKPKGRLEGTFNFVTRCVEAESAEEIDDMVEREQEVPFEEFVDAVCENELKNVMANFDLGESPLSLEHDPYVTFHKSIFRDKPCYYFVHSAIEHVFVED